MVVPKGNLKGSVRGNVLGDVYGDVNGHVLGDVLGDVYGDVLGNVHCQRLAHKALKENNDDTRGQKYDWLLFESDV